VTSELVVREEVRLGDVRVDGGEVVWSEGRPTEAGRIQLVRRKADGTLVDLLGSDHNARSAVHEYGGGAWLLGGGAAWFVNWADQRLYRLEPAGGDARPITPEPEVPRGDRYADGELSPDGRSIVCVREHHPPGGAVVDVRNEIVRLAADDLSEPEVLVSGPDFVSDPRLSHDGSRLCWLEWDHPNMPWDETRLRVRDLAGGEETTIAGGPGESVAEPQWQADGALTFISDRTGWSNLYRLAPGAAEPEPLVAVEAEIGAPMWVLGLSHYAVLESGAVVFARSRDGVEGIGVRVPGGEARDLDLPYTSVLCLRAAGPASVVATVAAPDQDVSIVRLGLDPAGEPTVETLRPARPLQEHGIGSEFIPVPEPVELPSADGRRTHGFLYRPTNPSFTAPDGELPPMIISVHGGPTSHVVPELELELLYFTTRGFAVFELNYGGSTGYGRAYRELLNGTWGVVDVEDAIAAARWAAEERLADPDRIVVRGASAGGYTTLAALARPDTPFAAGGDYFGVADLEAMTRDTHKFESRYLERLVGPYPERRDLYRQRSPIDHVDQFSTPLIVLQGLEDEVVPPNQATMIVEALKAKGIPVAYVPFEGEQHGFRDAANIRRALESELSFYARVLGFELPPEEGIEPVAIS
jgi:dipeptidyl aminopeptidase/acylaminoacyl peptidase